METKRRTFLLVNGGQRKHIGIDKADFVITLNGHFCTSSMLKAQSATTLLTTDASSIRRQLNEEFDEPASRMKPRSRLAHPHSTREPTQVDLRQLDPR
ncbi:hypothetical protein HPP92_021298 [Vanilla planifolia]|uniref:Uncharacterized protein n=1 Tax=Vanilla planifolia TaxID=51239 RepID=A0A835PV59_VANPL|nr:hypothetical protein HPP92_021298 [Vanilla planifolia]